MSHSYAETVELTCSQCQQPFPAELWLIVDINERPDLHERIRELALHEVPCPHCGHATSVEAPLLVFRPGQTPPLIFVPGAEPGAQHIQHQVDRLLAILKQRLGSTWQDEWLAESDTLRWLEPDAESPAVAEPDTVASLLPHLNRMAQAQSWEELQQIVEEHPKLLSDEADTLIGQAIAARQPQRSEIATPPALYDELRRAQAAEQHYERSGDLAALDNAATVWERIFDHDAFRTADVNFQVLAMNSAGGVLLRRYWGRGQFSDLIRAVDLWQRAVAVTQPDSSILAALLNNLGTGLRARYAHNQRLADLEAAIEAYHQAVAATRPDSPDLPQHLTNLGVSLRDHYLHSGKVADLEAAIEVAQQAVVTTPTGSLDLPARLNNLGIGLSDRYVHSGQIKDLEEVIEVCHQAVATTPANSPELPTYLNNLGIGLSDRYARSGQVTDLEAAIKVYHHAVAATPANSPVLAALLNNLGSGLRSRYAYSGQVTDLEAAIKVTQQAIAATPDNSPSLPPRLNNLGVGLSARYVRSGQVADLEAAIEVYRQAVAATSANSPDLPLHLNNLGIALRDRYVHSGRIEDLESAIEIAQQAVTATPADSPNLSMNLNNLGIALRDRYVRSGRIEDLDAAVEVAQQAATATPPDSPALAARLTNLGVCLRDRYVRSGQVADLEEAVEVTQQAVAATPPDSPILAIHLNNLGIGISDRYVLSQRIEDLEAAIEVYQQAVAATAPDSPALAMYLNNLGNDLRTRYVRSGRVEDLEAAIEVYQQAVAATAPDSPDLPARLNNLGNSLSDRFVHNGRIEDLDKAISTYRRACHSGLVSALDEAQRSARNWGRWAAQRLAWAEAAEAYTYGLEAASRRFVLQLSRSGQEGVLGQAQGIAALAAYTLARAGDLPSAVAAMERGRARILAQALEQNRRDLEALPNLGHADLHQRYLAAVSQRQRLLQSSSECQPALASPVSSNQHLTALNVNYEELQAVIAAIRQLPGYADFLTEPTFSKVQSTLATPTALVYLLATEFGGLALVVHTASIIPVWLDNLTEDRVRTWLAGPPDAPGGWLGSYQNWHWASVDATRLCTDVARQYAQSTQQTWFAVIVNTLAGLWTHIIEPLTAALVGLGLSPDDDQPPAITLIPTGMLALLPLHAAWTEDPATLTGRRYFFDDYAVRYAPSATALRHCHERAGDVSVERLLALDEPKPIKGGGLLPNSSREVKAIASLFSAPTVLQHEQANREATLDALSATQVAHFSCHGTNNWQNPLDSGLLLANDELLTVRDFLELHLPGARLATLSACETGIVGTDLPDEVIMLPSALVQAGYAGVVASLWSVADISTAMLMVRFYQYWREDGLEPAYALRAAQRWVRDTTNQEKADYFGQFVPGLGTRMAATVAAEFFSAAMLSEDGLEARSCAHPFWWGAFYLTGV